MLSYISSILISYGFNVYTANLLSNILLLLFITIVSLIAKTITTKSISKFLVQYIKRNHSKWDDILLNRKFFKRLSSLVPPLIVYFFIPSFSGEFQGLIEKIFFTYFTVVVLFVLNSLLNSANDIYNTFKISKNKPVKIIIQVLQIILFSLGAIIITANMLGKSPVIILSGIGALAAVFIVVFKDSLLGLVSGIQITTNDMIRIGDWIEMPKYDANGEVVDISLNTIKVENFDKTITNIPSYALISDSFKNWRNMQESGGRRIKRSIYIDSSSIEFCSDEMIKKLKITRYLSSYITRKQAEIEKYNNDKDIDPTKSINVRRLTNIGTFREYIEQYLKHHPSIHKGMIQMVRQLEPGVDGVPLEIYAFTNDTNWLNYEKIQADIFDHILSIAFEFNIRLFQNPSGYDIKIALEKSKQ